MKKYFSLIVVGTFTTLFACAQLSFSKYIDTSTDDAEENSLGAYITTTSSDLELAYDSWNNQGLQKTGLRFTAINIPVNAIISNAYIQFTADGASSGNVSLQIKGEYSANPATFTGGSSAGNSISSRPTTTSMTAWSNIPSWSNNESGQGQRTPDISAIVSEIITSNGWQSGNSIAFIITGDGDTTTLRRAYSYDGNSALPPKLVIEYTSVSSYDSLFFANTSAWRYWDNAATPGASWFTTSYNDSSWLIGSGHFGFGEGDEQTALSAGKASYYFRKIVTIANINAITNTYFHLVHDDAAVIYVNGQEVFRTELMPLGTITHFTTARQRIGSDIENNYCTYKIDASYFSSGENVIAISVHNVSTSDSDLSFECYSSEIFAYAQDGPYIFYGDSDITVTESLWLIYKLESEAEAQGGKVHLIIGNHEMFNLTDDWRYIETKYFTNVQLLGKRMIDLYAANTEIGRWIRTKNIIEKIGDYVFVHGGLSMQVAALGLSYNQINDYGRIEMNNAACTGPCATVNGSDGVYWYRDMAYEFLTQAEVDTILAIFDAKRVIFGHTKGSTVRSLYLGKALAIDMYHISNFANGYMEALQFELGCFYIFNTNGTMPTYTQLGDCDDFATTANLALKETDIQIYPNPAASLLHINVPGRNSSGLYHYTISDISGKIIIKF